MADAGELPFEVKRLHRGRQLWLLFVVEAECELLEPLPAQVARTLGRRHQARASRVRRQRCLVTIPTSAFYAYFLLKFSFFELLVDDIGQVCEGRLPLQLVQMAEVLVHDLIEQLRQRHQTELGLARHS